MIFKAALFLSIFMTGLIWCIQIVHYPLFAKIPSDAFTQYEQSHTRWISYLVAPMMVLELGIATLLFFNHYHHSLHIVAFVALLVVWGSTFGIQVPIHQKLSRNYNLLLIRKLVTSNWIRTVGWTVRSIVLLYLF